MNAKILIVEDEIKLQEFMSLYIKNAGYSVDIAGDGKTALKLFENNRYDLILLDVMLPKLNGYEVCEKIRNSSQVPIIMLTALESENHHLKGYEQGADDYITKPFKMKILLAKIQRFLVKQGVSSTQQTLSETTDLIIFDTLKINLTSRMVYVDDLEIPLAPKEYDLLVYLCKNKDMALSRNQILNAVWGYEFTGTTRVVDNHIKKLRNKLGQASDLVETVISHGYRFRVKGAHTHENELV